MLSALTKQAIFAQRRVALLAAVPAQRAFASDTLKDKEKGDERIFFTKNDGKHPTRSTNHSLPGQAVAS
jgi:hypothetical protein